MKEKVEAILRSKYQLDESEIQAATMDIVERCMRITGVPSDYELISYVDEYMDR